MFDWVLNSPLVLIGNILVFKILYFCTNVFAFDQLKRYNFRISLRKVSNKVGVAKNHRTIKTYCFHSSMVKIEFLYFSSYNQSQPPFFPQKYAYSHHPPSRPSATTPHSPYSACYIWHA